MLAALRSGSHKRHRRAEIGVVLAVVAVVALVAGGSVGVLVAIMLMLGRARRIIPVPAAPAAQADERFRRLVRLRRQAAGRRRARGLAPERLDVLDVLDDRTGWASVAERRELGVLPIPIASITGTVEEDKARAFDRELRPDRSCREHWSGLWLAHARGTALPPVSVYRVEQTHFLRDGHHRASVARDQGLTTLDAEVVELCRPHRA